MLTKSILTAVAAAAMGMAGIATADEAKGPTVMTDGEMSNIVAAGAINSLNGMTLFQISGGTQFTVVAGEADVVLMNPAAPDGMCRGVAGGGLTGGGGNC